MNYKKIIGGLCVAIALAFASYRVGQQSVYQGSFHPGLCGDSDNTGSYWSWGRWCEAKKASTLEIIWSQGCPPCRRLKVVAIRLLAEGYDIVLTSKYNDTHGSYAYPSLYYLDESGGVIRKEVGFKTADHIKGYLGK